MALSGIFDNTRQGVRLLYCTGTRNRSDAKFLCGFSVYDGATGFVIVLTVVSVASVHYYVLFKRRGKPRTRAGRTAGKAVHCSLTWYEKCRAFAV